MFAEFDEGNKGYISEEDLANRIAEVFGEAENAGAENADAVHIFFELSGATEKGLTYRQFEAALTGSSGGRQEGWLNCSVHRDPDGQE